MIRMKRLLATSLIAASVIGSISFVLADGPATTQGLDPKAQAQILVDQAKELLEQGKLSEAQLKNEAALKVAPDLLSAKVQQQQIKQKQEELKNPPINTTQTATTKEGTSTPVAGGAVQQKLTAEQMNRIKAYETTSKDKNLTGTIDQKTLIEFWDKVIMAEAGGRNLGPAERQAFLTGPFVDQVLAFKDSGRNEYIDKLKITSDPIAITKFSEVNTWVINSCAYQNGCHRIEDSTEKFRIYTRGGPLVKENLYTNFLIMGKTMVNNSYLIDRQRPDSSIALAYGLPAKDAIQSHPPKVRVQQRFTGLKDGAYTKLVDALTNLSQFTPNYGIEGTPPASAPAPK